MAKYEESVSAEAAWEAEATKLLAHRQLFRFYEVGKWLSRKSGRLKSDRDEAHLILVDLFAWFQRDEFDQSDVLVPISDPPFFLPVHSFLESAGDLQERNGRADEIRNLLIIESLILRRPALKLYLSRCGLEGAPRLWRELGFEEPRPAETMAAVGSQSLVNLEDRRPQSPTRAAPSPPRKRRGPTEGTVDRYSEADRALFPELERLKSEDSISTAAAAQKLADANKVSGIGNPQSRAKRLAERYRSERQN